MTEKSLVPTDTNNLITLSQTLLDSRMLPVTLRQVEQVAAIIVRGRELGIGPMEALTSINVIKGKVSSSTQLMLALIYRSGHLEDIEMVRGDPAKVTMKRCNMTPHTVTFGSEDAKRAGLLHKDTYKKWPEVMMLWRAVAICARVVFPDVIGAVYTPDELGVEMRSDVVWNGEIVKSEPDTLDLASASKMVEHDARIAELASNGKSAVEISAELGVPLPNVYQWLNENGEK